MAQDSHDCILGRAHQNIVAARKKVHRFTESGYPNVLLHNVSVTECAACGEQAVNVPRVGALSAILREAEHQAGGEKDFYMVLEYKDAPLENGWTLMDSNLNKYKKHETPPDEPTDAQCTHINAIPALAKGKHTWCIDCGANSTLTWEKDPDIDPLAGPKGGDCRIENLENRMATMAQTVSVLCDRVLNGDDHDAKP